MGNTIEKLEKNKIEFIKSLDIQDLKAYIDNLLKNYYESYISDDPESLKNNIDEITLFVDDFNSIYPNISNYIYSRMLFMSNKCLEKILQRDLKLFYPDNVDIENDKAMTYRNLFDEDKMRKIIAQEEKYYCSKCTSCKDYKIQ